MTPDEVSSVVFNLKKFVAHQTLDMNVLYDIGAETAAHFMADQLVFFLKARVLADDLPPEHLEQSTQADQYLPKSTWHMWKYRSRNRWYARWLVDRFPVLWKADPERRVRVTCTFDLERWRSYPQAKVDLPRDRFGNPVFHHAIRYPTWTQEAP